MDKTNNQLEQVKKHHFWIVAGGVLIVALACWFMGSNNLADETDANRQKREAKVRQVNQLPPNNPNDNFPKYAASQRDVLAKTVFEGWQKRFNEQRAIVYKWPSWYPPNYVNIINQRMREEKDLEREIREYYQSRAAEEFPKLYDIIGLRQPVAPPPGSNQQGYVQNSQGTPGVPPGTTPGVAPGLGSQDQEGGLAAGGGQTSGVEYQGQVAWTPTERQALENKFGGVWKTRVPTTLEMLYTQESINVYETLLKHIVKKLNEGAEEHQQATVKKIVTLLIGEDALPPQPAVVTPTDGGMEGNGGGQPGQAPAGGGVPPGTAPGKAPGVAPGSMPGGGGGGGAGRQPGQDAEGGSGQTASSVNPAPPNGVNRYIDDKGIAVGDPKKQPFAEFRMLPVKMRFVIDHRRIPNLLVACANSPLPIKVRQVSVSGVNAAASTDGAGGQENAFGTPPGVGKAGGGQPPGLILGQQGDEGGNQTSAAGQPVKQAFGEVELGPYDMEVEVQGTVLIYNEPNKDKLGTGTAAEAEEAAAAAGATPAGEPATTETPATPPTTTPPAGTPPAGTPPAGTPPAGTPPATPPATTPAPAPTLPATGTPPATGVPPATGTPPPAPGSGG